MERISLESAQADRPQINVSDAKELTYWAEVLGVTYTILNELIQKVGTQIDDVEAELNNQRALGSFTYIRSAPRTRLPSRSQFSLRQ